MFFHRLVDLYFPKLLLSLKLTTLGYELNGDDLKKEEKAHIYRKEVHVLT